ncbi:hypothetical protein QAD02_016121 [Eretmocerus hayati]|uniref:Uncharacterized protein n=1 Tax=Eretmocerus hayati TaxID=131215 RepID=A0ACC2P9P0_9HYME|nr:hypothetical protein QAD02_016121 [Eretmocerus hayati]
MISCFQLMNLGPSSSKPCTIDSRYPYPCLLLLAEVESCQHSRDGQASFQEIALCRPFMKTMYHPSTSLTETLATDRKPSPNPAGGYLSSFRRHLVSDNNSSFSIDILSHVDDEGVDGGSYVMM